MFTMPQGTAEVYLKKCFLGLEVGGNMKCCKRIPNVDIDEILDPSSDREPFRLIVIAVICQAPGTGI